MKADTPSGTTHGISTQTPACSFFVFLAGAEINQII